MKAARAFGTALMILVVGAAPQGLATASEHDGPGAESCAGWQPSPHRDPRTRRLEYLSHFYRHFSHERGLAAAAMLPEDMTWSMTGWRKDVIPFAGDYVGRRDIGAFFHRYFHSIRVKDYDFEYKLMDGDHVSWHFRMVAQVPSTGKTFDVEFVHIWTFAADGRPMAVRAYYDTQLMAEAFTVGGPAYLVDRKNPTDDYVVRASAYDVQALVTTLYDNFYAGNLPAVFAMVTDAVYVYFQGKDNPQSGEYHGFAGVQQFVMNLAGTAYPYDIQRFYVTEGDRTDVVLFEHWTVYATGKSYHVHTVNSWRVDDQGKLMGFINYPDIDEVAAAYVP